MLLRTRVFDTSFREPRLRRLGDEDKVTDVADGGQQHQDVDKSLFVSRSRHDEPLVNVWQPEPVRASLGMIVPGDDRPRQSPARFS